MSRFCQYGMCIDEPVKRVVIEEVDISHNCESLSGTFSTDVCEYHAQVLEEEGYTVVNIE